MHMPPLQAMAISKMQKNAITEQCETCMHSGIILAIIYCVRLFCLNGNRTAPRTIPERNIPERNNPNLFSGIYVIIPKPEPNPEFFGEYY